MRDKIIGAALKSGGNRRIVVRISPRQGGGAIIRARNRQSWKRAKTILIESIGGVLTSASKKAPNGHALESGSTPSAVLLLLHRNNVI